MLSALLATLAVSALPVYLYPQQSLSDVAWPTHATITVPEGWIKPDGQPYLLEDGQPMLCQVEVAARWPDESPKWLHAHGLFRYTGGKPAKYSFVPGPQLPPEMPKSPLVVTDDDRGIHIDTGVIQLVVARPFAGITMLAHDGQTLIRGTGGPSVVDGDGTVWHAMHDGDAQIVLEQNGPAAVTVSAIGWYQTAEARDDAFCRFTTRITAFANSPIVKIDHATTFADDMKKHAVAELAFSFPLSGATAFSSSTLRSKFHDKLRAAYLAQLTDDRLWRIAQFGEDPQRDIRYQGDYERNAGWFSAQVGTRRVALLTKDFWQKCPKEVKISPDELVYYAWPKHGELSRDDPDATRPEKVYQFQCFHRGDLLTSSLPDDYFEALENQQDTTECKAEFARAANLQGVSIHNEFALAIVPDASDATAADEYLEKLQELYLRDPVARVSPAAIAASGVFGPVAAAGDDHEDLESVVVDGMLGYARSIPRYGDYGWAIYGNTHHTELMHPELAGLPKGRPSLHRVWNNNHYKYVSTSWQIWALNGDPRILDWARMCTDTYGSIGQVRYDNQWYREAGSDARRPSVKYHHPGAFYHCKGFVPWGARPYGMKAMDIDAAWSGHWTDPSGLLFAWLLDADRWAKDGYELWLDEAQLPETGWAREGCQNLVQAINAYEYRPSDKTLKAIRAMAKGLTSAPLTQQKPGPLWDPTWLSRYHEMFPDDEAFRKFLVESADALGVQDGGIWSLALSATAYDITGDRTYLLRHAGTLDRTRRRLFQDPQGRWQNYGHAPAPGRDGFFALQWPRFLAALRKEGFRRLPAPEEPGQYLSSVCRYDSESDIEARGTKILMLKPPADRESYDTLTIQASVVSGGDIHATSLMLTDPVGSVALREPRLAMSNGAGNYLLRPSSWKVAHEKFLLPTGPGLYTLLVGSYEIGIFQGVAGGMPECQVIQNNTIRNSSQPVKYRCKLTTGYLVPRTDAPISLRFKALGTSDGSYVAITPAEGPKGGRWLVAGDTAEIALGNYPAPWLLEIHGDYTSATEMEVVSSVDEPLFYGRNLEHIRLISEQLDR